MEQSPPPEHVPITANALEIFCHLRWMLPTVVARILKLQVENPRDRIVTGQVNAGAG